MIPSEGVNSKRFGKNLSGTEVFVRSSVNSKLVRIFANAIFTSMTANLLKAKNLKLQNF